MSVSLDTLITIGAIVGVGMYLVAQALIGVNFARLAEARRIAAEGLRDEPVANRLFEDQQHEAARDREVIERLIAYRPPTSNNAPHDKALHTARGGSP